MTETVTSIGLLTTRVESLRAEGRAHLDKAAELEAQAKSERSLAAKCAVDADVTQGDIDHLAVPRLVAQSTTLHLKGKR